MQWDLETLLNPSSWSDEQTLSVVMVAFIITCAALFAFRMWRMVQSTQKQQPKIWRAKRAGAQRYKKPQ